MKSVESSRLNLPIMVGVSLSVRTAALLQPSAISPGHSVKKARSMESVETKATTKKAKSQTEKESSEAEEFGSQGEGQSVPAVSRKIFPRKISRPFLTIGVAQPIQSSDVQLNGEEKNMDYLPKFKVAEYSGQPVTVAQEKFNGYFVEVYRAGGYDIMVCTKNQADDLWPKLSAHTVIRRQIERLPDDTCLRCELHAPGVPATSVPTMLNDADLRLLLSPFQIVSWAGTRWAMTFEAEKRILDGFGFTTPRLIRLSDRPETIVDVGRWTEYAEELGIEGWVVKDFPGGDCFKIKPQKTVDAFVVGYALSDRGACEGGLKSIHIAVMQGAEEKIVASVGVGFDNDYRMMVDPESLVGRVGEFKYQAVGARGKLQFPRFLRWRDDEKTKEECLIEQLV